MMQMESWMCLCVSELKLYKVYIYTIYVYTKDNSRTAVDAE